METINSKDALKLRGRKSADQKINKIVLKIKEDVLKNDDQALKKLTKELDGVELLKLRVEQKRINRAYQNTPAKILNSLKDMAKRIEIVNQKIKKISEQRVKIKGEGYEFNLISTPIENVGLYVPGGRAFYPSSMLMLGIPAKVAGVKRIVVCTPPNAEDQGIPSITLAAAKLIGIDEIYQVGGAQAIFAMAYGTETIKRVDKIFGPGNSYVNKAKMMLGNICGVDMFAGPSEILVLADENANSNLVKVDLLSQIEHGPGSNCVLVSSSKKLINKMSDLKQGFAVLVENTEEGIQFANQYRAEHTEVMTKNAREDAFKIQGGAVFIGSKTCVPMGDYGVSGSNHVIPTSAATRFQSPLSVTDFMIKTEYTEVMEVSKASNYVPEIARLEGLDGHAEAVRRRLGDL